MKKVNVAILGFGTVGAGTYKMLEMNKAHVDAISGRDIEVVKVLDLYKDACIKKGLPEHKFTDKIEDIINDPSIDIVVECMGGIDIASKFMLMALEAGKHAVTSNKAALAANWDKLNKAAREHAVCLYYEASVGGGIPIISALRFSLFGNIYEEVMGIVNGTTNYILTKMAEEGQSYEEALKKAQELGFAEADPTADVEGIDAANKLSILMAVMFDVYVPPMEIPRKGITGVTKEDIEKAAKEGKKIKLIAKARRLCPIDKKPSGKEDLEFSVEPTLIDISHPLAGVSNEFNAIYVKGNAVGETMFYGKGAGALPTGSAILNDVIQIARLI